MDIDLPTPGSLRVVEKSFSLIISVQRNRHCGTRAHVIQHLREYGELLSRTYSDVNLKQVIASLTVKE